MTGILKKVHDPGVLKRQLTKEPVVLFKAVEVFFVNAGNLIIRRPQTNRTPQCVTLILQHENFRYQDFICLLR